MKTAKILGTIVGIVAFVALVAGFTYAWFTWQSSNTNISGSSNCFNINYGISQEIGASSAVSLKLGKTYADGLSAKVTVGLDASCTGITGTGTLYLNTNTASTSTSILGGALKYTVLKVSGTTKTEVASGAITSANKTALVQNIGISSSSDSTYEVWVWIDGALADNTYANNNYSGYISLEAVQDK